MRTKGAEMAGKDGDKALRRIIQMLLALSLLAERASGAYYPVRFLVLLFLRPGEAAARGFVQEMVETPLPIADLTGFPSDNSPLGALRLALCFRALAAVLQYLLDEPQPFMRDIRRSDSDDDARPAVQCLNERSPVGLPGSRAPPPRFQAGQTGETPEPKWLCGALWRAPASAAQPIRSA